MKIEDGRWNGVYRFAHDYVFGKPEPRRTPTPFESACGVYFQQEHLSRDENIHHQTIGFFLDMNEIFANNELFPSTSINILSNKLKMVLGRRNGFLIMNDMVGRVVRPAYDGHKNAMVLPMYFYEKLKKDLPDQWMHTVGEISKVLYSHDPLGMYNNLNEDQKYRRVMATKSEFLQTMQKVTTFKLTKEHKHFIQQFPAGLSSFEVK